MQPCGRDEQGGLRGMNYSREWINIIEWRVAQEAPGGINMIGTRIYLILCDHDS